MPAKVNENVCMRCGGCTSVCPVQALELQEILLVVDTDKCIECGFCEVNCVTFGFTLSSRQRIVIRREIARLTASGEDNERLKDLKKQYS